MSNRITVAVVQAEHDGTLAGSLSRTAALAREAARSGARLIAFPETWIPGYPIWVDLCRDVAVWDSRPAKRAYARMAENSIALGDASERSLSTLARELESTIVIGVCERASAQSVGATLYNSLFIYGPDGRLLNHHRKMMPTHGERLVWGLGDREGVRAVNATCRVGALICWEHWMPLARQAMHEAGEDVHVALWPTVKELNHVACRAYAFEGKCFVLAAGALMRAASLPPELETAGPALSDEALVLHGGSAIIGPDGQYVVEPLYDVERILVAELDLGRVAEERMYLDVSGHYSRPDLFGLATSPTSGRRVHTPTAAAPPEA